MWMNGCPRILWNLSLVLWVDWWTVWCWKKSVVPQSCPTLWDPMDCSLPGFSVLKIFQARILEWVAISFSRGSSRSRDLCVLSRFSGVWLFETLWTVAHQVPLSMDFSRQEYWNGLPFPPLGYLPDPGIEPTSPALAGGFFTGGPTGKPQRYAEWNKPDTAKDKHYDFM